VVAHRAGKVETPNIFNIKYSVYIAQHKDSVYDLFLQEFRLQILGNSASKPLTL